MTNKYKTRFLNALNEIEFLLETYRLLNKPSKIQDKYIVSEIKEIKIILEIIYEEISELENIK